jgi:hypothetical protein
MAELHDCYTDEIVNLSRQDTDNNGRERYENRLAEYILILHLWDALPKELLDLFWKHASTSVLRHAMWYVGNQVSRPSSEVPDEVKARGLEYWELRLARAISSNEPDKYRAELGVIGNWCFHGQIDETWLCDQLLRMLNSGFAPTDPSTVIEWLGKIAQRHVDRAVAVMSALLRVPGIDQWAYMTEREEIRAVLSAGIASNTPETAERAQATIAFLSTLGETSYLDLVRPTVAA